MTDKQTYPWDKNVNEGFFTKVTDAEKDAIHAQRVNEKIKMILRLVADADQLMTQNKESMAKKIYIECAEAMHKLSEQTKDDPNFHAALIEKRNVIIRKAEGKQESVSQV